MFKKKIAIFALCLISSPVIASELSQRLPSDARDISLSSVQLGVVQTGSHYVKTDVACDEASYSNECGTILVADYAPNISFGISYSSDSQACGFDGSSGVECSSYISVPLTAAQANSLNSGKRNLRSLFSMKVTYEKYSDALPGGHYENCHWNAEYGVEEGLNCRYFADAPVVSQGVAPVVHITSRSF